MKFLSGIAFASAIVAANAAVSTGTVCLTASGTSSVKKVPTKSTTVKTTSTRTVTKTTVATTTITGTGTTIVVTDTTTTDSTTTLPTNTDTITATAFSTTTTTVEAPPVTSTSTETDSATTTTTIGPFFTGVQDTLPGADAYTGPSKRDVSLPRRRNVLQARASPSQYPTAVSCTKSIKVVTRTTTTVPGTSTATVSTTSAPVTSTDTVTITNTITTAPQDASTTVTTTSTITDTEVDTSTSTTVTTTTTTQTFTVQNTPTAACDSSNMADSVNGVNIINATPDNDNASFLGASANGVTSCCNVCAGLDTCAAWTFSLGSGECQVALDTTGTCSVNQDGFQALLASSSTGGRSLQYVVGNGICGDYDSSYP